MSFLVEFGKKLLKELLVELLIELLAELQVDFTELLISSAV